MLDFSDPAPAPATEVKHATPHIPALQVMQLDNDMLEIKGLSKSLVLSELFNAAKQPKLDKPYRTIDEAWTYIRKNGLVVEEWDGRQLHVDLREAAFSTTVYDKHAGKPGVARSAIEAALVMINRLPWDRKAHDVQLGWEKECATL